MRKYHKCKGSNLPPGMVSHSLKFSLDADKESLNNGLEGSARIDRVELS